MMAGFYYSSTAPWFLVIICLQLCSKALSYNVHLISTAPVANSNGSITFGLPVTLNGTSATYLKMGPMIRNTLEMWVWWVNEIHGGIKVGDQTFNAEVKYVNDWHSSAHVTNITKYLIEEEGAQFMFAPYSTTLTKPAAVVAEDHKIITIAGSASSTSIYTDKKYLFTPLTSSGELMTAGIKSLALRGAETIVKVTQDKTFTQSMCSPLNDYADELAASTGSNVRVIASYVLPAVVSDADVEALMRNLTALPEHVDISVGCVYYDVCTRMIAASKAHGYAPDAMLHSICVDNGNFLADTGADDGRYILGAVNWHEDMQLTGDVTGWSAKQYADLYRANYSATPPYQSAAYFAGGLALLRAIEDAGTFSDSDEVAFALSRLDIDTFFGTINFNSVNQNSNDFSYVQYDENAELQIVIPDAVATGPLIHPMPSWSDRQCVLDYGEGSCKCSEGGCPECTLQDYNYTVGECAAAGEYRLVEFQRATECEGGLATPEPQRIDCDHVPLASPTAAVVQALAYLGFTIGLASLVFVVVFRRAKIIKASQFEFCVLIAVGGAVCALSPVASLGENSRVNCGLRPLLFHLSFCSWVGALWVKTFRVWRIFGNTQLKKVRFTAKDSLKMWAGVMAVPAAVLALCFAVEGPWPRTTAVELDFVAASVVAKYTSCRVSETWTTALVAYEVGLVGLACYFSFRNRRVGSAFSETKYLVVAVYTLTLILGLANLVAAQDVGLSVRVLLRGVGTSLGCAVSLGSIFLPKAYLRWALKDRDVFQTSSAAATAQQQPPKVSDQCHTPKIIVRKRDVSTPSHTAIELMPTDKNTERVTKMQKLISRLNAKLPAEEREFLDEEFDTISGSRSVSFGSTAK
eukprot:CAMPEP_0206392814 /NCGR_PEP_ID=MMETSP0294-20121207/20233_1 /ASSEMBLY_ACC=CAM_ASM_000327 /TAXON_ID=39354 /ORGANISM="Heterosigma akashiwo, Strain CCMP2393" /LENGTH=861 /DNA_ID=CAMNT_0053846065 /DNA_START=44 /DNA_END=2629 /DNA_ORIENTATION=-